MRTTPENPVRSAAESTASASDCSPLLYSECFFSQVRTKSATSGHRLSIASE